MIKPNVATTKKHPVYFLLRRFTTEHCNGARRWLLLYVAPRIIRIGIQRDSHNVILFFN